jgi:hypothetical protein
MIREQTDYVATVVLEEGEMEQWELISVRV